MNSTVTNKSYIVSSVVVTSTLLRFHQSLGAFKKRCFAMSSMPYLAELAQQYRWEA